MHWYNSLNPQTLEVEQRNHEAKAEQLWQEIQTLDQDIQEISSQLGEIAPAIVTKLKLFKWLTKEQTALRRKDVELRAVQNHKVSQKQSKDTDLDATLKRIASVANKLEQHRTFPLSDRQGELSRLKQSIADKTAELDSVTDRKRRVDKEIAPLLREMENLELDRGYVESALEVAEDFNQRLSLADNSYERAMIHKECEELFGEGKPGKIISERQWKISKLKRDYDKARRRAEQVAEKAARRIDKVIIDGNNLCYEGKDFIGLAAIEAILPLLSRMYEVVVVFDSNSKIRKLLNTDDDGLHKRLASFAKVHVVAYGQKADETVVKLASANEFIYVLSNDRFGEFNDKSAVKKGRLTTHEVVNGNVFVHDLQLQAAYR